MLIGGITGVAFWLVIMIILLIVEGVTFELVSIWFGVGALAAMIPAGLYAPLWVQLLVFLLASLVSLAALRPLLRSKVTPKKAPTNADRLIGQTGVVREAINNELATGRISIAGLDWTARSADESLTIPEGARVTAVRIDGVKMVVEPAEVPAKVLESI